MRLASISRSEQEATREGTMQRALRWIASAVLSAGLASGCASLGGALGRIGPERSVIHTPSVCGCGAQAEDAEVFELQRKSNSSEMG
jgi:hypothetical protein